MIESPPQRKWTVHLIHHTHTDIGYTESQGRIARFHADFLDQVLAIARRLRAGDPSPAGFRWTNECFWSVEQWLARHGPDRGAELAECIREGVIELTGTYLHFTELIDEPLLRAALARAGAFARDHGLTPPDTALSADINGFGRGHAQALLDSGIRNLVTCVHSHHGLAPLGKRQAPFFWETPGGGELLVWSGEIYTQGNALGLAPGAANTYGFQDELHPRHRQADTYPLAAKRLPRYLRQLELDGYPYDFVPLHISGALTDNAPPSEAIARFTREWNARHGEGIRLHMSSASDFCRLVRAHPAPIPRHRGDWPDWWSDGLASTPGETRMAREAMRSLRWLRRLSERRGIALPAKETAALEQNALLYAEHTFNHSDAMSTPWDLTAKAVGGNKKAVACAACEAAVAVQDSVFRSLGEMPNAAPGAVGERMVYKVLNPGTETVTDLARLYLESRDFDRIPFDPVVTDLRSGAALACATSPAPRGRSFDFPLTLAAGEEAVFELGAGMAALRSTRRHFTEAAAADDVEGAEVATRGFRADATGVETASLRLAFGPSGEIASLIDKRSGAELLQAGRRHAPFTPVYDVTPAGGKKQDDLRRGFGRNRKGANARRSDGFPRPPRFPAGGDFRIPVEIDYTVEGAAWLTVLLFIWRDLPRIDVAVRLQKTSVWDAENLYLALPFAAPGGELWIDKPGGALRPWRDQLPDTLTDWFCIQEGFASCGPDLGVVVSTPDAPLLQLGPLDFGKRRLMGHPGLLTDLPRPYSWLMTNYWETNFEANLGGFHEFTYRVEFGRHLADPAQAVRHCGLLNHGLKSFRIPPPPPAAS